MPKGRKKGSKVESYTFSFSYVADKDVLAVMKTAQLSLRAMGISPTRSEMITTAVEHYLNGLSPQKMVSAVEAGLLASQLREMKSQQETLTKEINRIEAMKACVVAIGEMD